jgi:hypothetical protein
MPCSSGYTAEDSLKEVRKELDRVTRVACELASFAKGFKRSFSRETMDWMADHARLDRARRLREEADLEERRIKNSALRKLSPKERKLLGL